MTAEERKYRFFYAVFKSFICFFYPIRVVGREHIPQGASVVCANHSSWTDPFLVAFAFTNKRPLSFMAKAELFKNKLSAGVLRAVGAFPVNRGETDIEAMKTAVRCLKSGKRLGIFPEGTRVQEDGDVSPKLGAVRIAEKTDVPIVPVYVPRRKKIFRRITIVIGEPIIINKAEKKRSREDYEAISDELMESIAKLGDDAMMKAGAKR